LDQNKFVTQEQFQSLLTVNQALTTTIKEMAEIQQKHTLLISSLQVQITITTQKALFRSDVKEEALVDA